MKDHGYVDVHERISRWIFISYYNDVYKYEEEKSEN